ncbi:MAG TPA: acyl-CoA dehydrogenase [Burkholderiales bacterium]|jgi:acyl-CoA dehydrogenase|nr:acyl-CoA dehydrogenase [Burkholderiales bacterium]
MSTYAAPIRDMKFVINELVGLDQISALPGCEEVTPDLVDAVLEEAGKFAAGVLDPLNKAGDRTGAKLDNDVVTATPGFKEAFRKFSEGGWTGLNCDPQFGGQGLPHIISAQTSEMWNAANMSFCLCPMLTAGVVAALMRHGSDQQKTLYLPNLVSGKWTGTMNLTEPQAGSDLAAVRTRAVPESDHYRLHGTKIFITWGEHDMAENIIHMVLARTPDAPEGVKGISLFVVPKFLVNRDGSLGKRNDVRCVSIEHKLGIHGSPTCVMAYGDADGAIGHLVGEENRGLEFMFTMMNFARLEVGIEGVAIAERAYQHALEYAKNRVQGREIGVKGGDRVAIIHHPDVRRMLMSMKAQTEAMRAIATLGSAYLDKALRHPDKMERARSQALFDLLTPVVKGWCTEQCIEIASIGVQVHGGMGFVEETGAAQYLRDARITTIYEGTTGIQANDLIGRKIAYEKGATIKLMITEMRALDGDLAKVTHPGIAVIRRSLSEGVAALTEATDWLLAIFPHNMRAAAAGAVPFLKLFGVVAGGWQMARAALIAKRRLDEGAEDYDFYRAKIGTARFYAEHVLPLARPCMQEIVNGSTSVLALEEAQF